MENSELTQLLIKQHQRFKKENEAQILKLERKKQMLIKNNQLHKKYIAHFQKIYNEFTIISK